MTKSTFLVCGEILFDLFQDGTSNDPKRANYQARIGGSPYNVAMGLARFGTDAAFFAGISNDFFGDRLRQAITEENIADWALVDKDNHTTLSFVALDEAGSPEYAFFNNQAADISLEASDIPQLDAATRIIHAGSYSLVVPPTADTILALMQQHKERFISLDPNIRPTVQSDMNVWKHRIDQLLPLANLVKVSTEDLEFLDATLDPITLARTWLERGPELVIITDGGSQVIALNAHGQTVFEPQPVDVVDTVGAGDTFMAATLYYLNKHGFVDQGMSQATSDDLKKLMAFASSAAAITCSRRGADLPTLAEINS